MGGGAAPPPNQTKMEELRERIANNAQDYNAYVDLLPQVAGEEKLALLERFSQNFPLDEKTWLDWLQMTASDGDRRELFKRALQDYLSPALIVAYLDSIPNEQTEFKRGEFIAQARVCGSHYTRAHLFWEAWIKFETSVGNSSRVQLPMQMRACLAIENVQTYWDEFIQAFPDLRTEFQSSFDSALQTAQRMAPQEQILRETRQSMEECAGSPVTAANPRLEKEWLNHLWLEQKAAHRSADEMRILYERAIGDCCLSTRIWQAYTRFAESNFASDPELVRSIAQRAVRNVPTSAVCWASLLRCTNNDDEAQVDAVWRSTLANMQRGSGGEDLVECALMYLMKRASEFDTVLDDLHDEPNVLVELLLVTLPQPGNRKRNWERVHQLRAADESLWLLHIAEEERNKASVGRLRELYGQAMNAVKQNARGIEVIGNAWLRFEFAQITPTAPNAMEYCKAVDMVAKRRRECARVEPLASRPRKQQDVVKVASKDTQQHPQQQNKKKRAVQEEAVATSQETQKRLKREEEDKMEEDVEGSDSREVFIPLLPETASTKDVLRAYFSNKVGVEGAFVQMVNIGVRRDQTKFAHVTFGGVAPRDAVLAAKAACKLSGKDMEILLSKPPPKRAKPTAAVATAAVVKEEKKKMPATAFMPRALATASKKKE